MEYIHILMKLVLLQKLILQLRDAENHIIVNDPCNSGPSHFYLSQIHGESGYGIVMGQENELKGTTKNSIIAGGYQNIITDIGFGVQTAICAFIGGGQGNIVLGNYSSAFGQNADAKKSYSAVFGLNPTGTSAPFANTLTVGVGNSGPNRGIYYIEAPTGTTGCPLAIRANGQIIKLPNFSSVSGTNPPGNEIAIYTNETGATAGIYETITNLNQINTGGNEIAIYTNETGETAGIYETITNLNQINTGGNEIAIYTNETGATAGIYETVTNISETDSSGNEIAIYTNESGETAGIYETITNLNQINTGGNEIAIYTNETGATAGIYETITNLNQINTGGNEIAIYTNETGATAGIYETVTQLVNNNDGTYTYTNETGATTEINLAIAGCGLTFTNNLIELERNTDMNALSGAGTGVYRNHIIVNDPCSPGESHFYLSQIHGESGYGIVMGQENKLNGNTKNSTIAGGYQNTITGANYAFIGGGQGNTASGNYSIAFGRNADAKENNSAVFGLNPTGTSAPFANTLTFGVGDSNPDRGIYYITAPTGATGAALSVRDDGQIVVPDQLLMADGSSAAPAYSFRSDSDVGMYYTLEDSIPRINLNAITNVYSPFVSGNPYIAIGTTPLSPDNFGFIIAPDLTTNLSRFDMYQKGNMTISNRSFIMKFNNKDGAGDDAGVKINRNNEFVPYSDNKMSLGSSCLKWTEVWAVDGTINPSDQTLKKDISDISEEDSLKFISGLTPKKYNFIDSSSNREGYLHYGLMAQDVKICMQSCNFNDFGGYVEDIELDEDGNQTGPTGYGLRYSSFIPPIIKSIQSLSKTNKKTGMNENTNNSKNNIKNENMGLSFINELRPVTYDMDDTKHHGLVIDEVKSTLDTLSIPMEEIGIINGVSGISGCYEINYKELVTPLIKAVQELSARVATLEALQQ
jgi:hypothetical protein